MQPDYAALKRSLAGESVNPNDRNDYRAGKSDFVDRITREALGA